MIAILMPRKPVPPLPSDGILALRRRAEHARNRAQECEARSMTQIRAAYEEDARACESAIADLLTLAYLTLDLAKLDAEFAGHPHRWSEYLSETDADLVDQAAHFAALHPSLAA